MDPQSQQKAKENAFQVLYRRSKSEDKEELYESDAISKPFLDFLKKFHGKCNLEKGIKVCDRNNFGIITVVQCMKCKEHISTVFDAHADQVRIVRLEESIQLSLEEVSQEENRSAAEGNQSDAIVSEPTKRTKQTLNPGDHIAWHRPFGYWHHAIVIDNPKYDSPDSHCVTGFRDKSCCCMQSNNDCQRIARVRVIEHTFDEGKFQIKKKNYDIFECMDVCRLEYCASYPPEYTVELAEETLRRFKQNDMKESYHELIYDPFGGNCEHFARRCKTGSSESGQVKDCHRECSKGLLLAFLRMVSLLIWFICEVVIDEEEPTMMANKAISEYKNATNAALKIRLNAMELYISVSLSVLFFIAYFIYSVFREIAQIRYPLDVSHKTTECCRMCSDNNGCCYRDDCACLWCIVCLIICRPFYECCTGCSACSRCCSKTFGSGCKYCGLFCTNYFNVIVRLFIREVIGCGLPVVAFFLFEKYVDAPKSWTHKDILMSFCGFLVSLCVSIVISMPFGAILASTVEVLCLGCCLKCCSKTSFEPETKTRVETEMV